LVLQDDLSLYIYGPRGLPLEQVSTSRFVTWFHQDQVGSTRLLTDSSGKVTGAFTYDAYGILVQATGTVVPRIGYAGQYTDPESSWEYLRARYYDPATGQFLSRDALTAVTRAAYGYAANSPLNATDPTGHCLGWLWGASDCQFSPPASVDQALSNASDGGVTCTVFDGDSCEPIIPTAGICVSGEIAPWENAAFGSLCVTESHWNQFATTFGPGVGYGTPGGSLTIGPMFSNADHPCQLKGLFSEVGGSLPEIPLGGSAQFGTDNQGNPIWVGFFGMSWGSPGAYGGFNNTMVHPLGGNCSCT
jgi:RHS repeat-associated protein